MSKTQTPNVIIDVEYDDIEGQTTELISPYRQRVYRDGIQAQRTNSEILEDFSIFEDSGLTWFGLPLIVEKLRN